MLELRLHTRFAEEAREQTWLITMALVDRLQRDLAAEPAVADRSDLPHPAAAEEPGRLVALVEALLVEDRTDARTVDPRVCERR
jgi:hypothetical protein